jgi:hypothetical protein
VIEDSKEELAIAAIFYASIQEFQEEFEKDFIKDEEKKEQVVNHYLQQNDIKFVEYDVSYDSELKLKFTT